MIKIYVDSHKVWDFFRQNKAEMLTNMIPIAENTDTDTVVYITDVHGAMCVAVYINDELEYEEPVMAKYDAQFTMEFIYSKYIMTSEPEDEPEDEDDDEDEDEDDEDLITDADIEIREHEIHTAFEDFISAIVDPTDLIMLINDPASFEDLKTYVLEAISEAGYPVFRPTYILDYDCEGETLVCFPYEV